MVDVRNLTRTAPQKLPYEAITHDILGNSYELSLVFIGKKRSRRLKREHLGIDKPGNVISFPLDKQAGELFLTPSVIKPEELLYMFIHGLLHLKGLDHGDTMDAQEQTYLRKWQAHSLQG